MSTVTILSHDPDSIMEDALTSMQELAEQVRYASLDDLHRSLRSWIGDRPEHAAVMLLAAACLVDPDETTSARRSRLASVLTRRIVSRADR